jgi:hypothetical protein
MVVRTTVLLYQVHIYIYMYLRNTSVFIFFKRSPDGTVLMSISINEASNK